MRWSAIGTQHCSIARALSVVGDTWTVLVVRELFNGNHRFNALLEQTGAPAAILSDRLSTLEHSHVIDKRPYSRRADRFEYQLTDKGRDLYPVLVSFMAWGDRWMANDEPPPVRLRHQTCGQISTPTLTCSACGEPIDPRAMRREIEADSPAPASSACAGAGADANAGGSR